MALQDDLNRLQKQLGNFLFPRKCPFCGAVTGGRLLCGSCERALPYTGENALRPGAAGGRGRRRGVPDAGPHRGGALIKGSAACGETPPVWKCRKRRTIALGLVCGGM